MKENRLWKKHQRNEWALRIPMWIRPYTVTHHEFDPKTGQFTDVVVHRPSRIYMGSMWSFRITCLDNDWCYYPRYVSQRYPKHVQNLRAEAAADEDFREEGIVRGLRPRPVPDDRDDLFVSPVRSWKKTHRCRKQWMKNIKG